METTKLVHVKLTKKALNEFIGWTTSRYNNYLGYGTKKEAIDKVFYSIINGYYTSVWFHKNGTRREQKDEQKVIFEIKCASPVGESGTNKKGSYWSTKQVGDDYTVDCLQKTITAKYSKRTIKFL